MLHPITRLRTTRSFTPRSVGISVVVHAVLLAGAAAMSSRATIDVHMATGDVPEPVLRYTLIFPRPPESIHTGAPARTQADRPVRDSRAPERTPTHDRMAAIAASLARLELPLALPMPFPAAPTQPDYAAIATAGFDPGAGPIGGLAAALGSVYARALGNDAFHAHDVDRTTWPRRGNPVPEYPRELLHAGVEGAYDVTYVVDSTGRVDRTSIKVPQHAHRLFAAAIRRALARSRFFPAMVAGKPVPQLVQQQFRFEVQRQALASPAGW